MHLTSECAQSKSPSRSLRLTFPTISQTVSMSALPPQYVNTLGEKYWPSQAGEGYPGVWNIKMILVWILILDANDNGLMFIKHGSDWRVAKLTGPVSFLVASLSADTLQKSLTKMPHQNHCRGFWLWLPPRWLPWMSSTPSWRISNPSWSHQRCGTGVSSWWGRSIDLDVVLMLYQNNAC